MRSTTHLQGTNTLIDRFIQRGHRFLHEWSDLDRIEEFASRFGAAYARRIDPGALALGSALCALTVLIIGQWT